MAPSKQRLVHPSVLAGRFSPADCIIRLHQVLPQRRVYQASARIPLDAQPMCLATLSLHMLSPATITAGLRAWGRDPGFYYRFQLPSRVEVDESELQDALRFLWRQGGGWVEVGTAHRAWPLNTWQNNPLALECM